MGKISNYQSIRCPKKFCNFLDMFFGDIFGCFLDIFEPYLDHFWPVFMSVFDRFLLIYLLKFHSFCKKLYFWYENSKYLLLRLKISLDFGAKIQINIKVNFLLKLDRLLESFIHNLLGYPIISKNYRLLFENQFVNKYLCKKNSKCYNKSREA